MDGPAGPAMRWLRACLLAAVSVGLAVGAHASAGGTVPGVPALLLVLAATATVSAALLGRPASALRVGGLLVAGQAFVHVWLSVTAAASGHPGAAGAAALAHDGGTMSMSSGSTSGLGMSASMGSHMLLAHLVAATGVGLWLVLGERALWSVLGLSATGVRGLLRSPWTVRVEPPVAVFGSDLLTRGSAAVTERRLHLVRRRAVLCRSIARRGPPVPRST